MALGTSFPFPHVGPVLVIQFLARSRFQESRLQSELLSCLKTTFSAASLQGCCGVAFPHKYLLFEFFADFEATLLSSN